MLPRPTVAQLTRSPTLLIAFGFGTGLSPRGPGTVGSLAGLALLLPLSHLPLPAYLGVLLAAVLVGIAVCGRAARLLGVHDHPGIVWDEIVGIWVTFIAVPTGPGWLLAGFVLFRLLDILKPWPIGAIDRGLGGGFGIMADDLVAGLLALAVLQLASRWTASAQAAAILGFL